MRVYRRPRTLYMLRVVRGWRDEVDVNVMFVLVAKQAERQRTHQFSNPYTNTASRLDVRVYNIQQGLNHFMRLLVLEPLSHSLLLIIRYLLFWVLTNPLFATHILFQSNFTYQPTTLNRRCCCCWSPTAIQIHLLTAKLLTSFRHHHQHPVPRGPLCAAQA